MPISRLHGIAPITVIKKAVRKFNDDDMQTYASALAYHVLFSFFPFVILLVATLNALGLAGLFRYFDETAQTLFSTHAVEQLNLLIEELRVPQGELLSFGILIAIWMASRGTRGLMRALNVAYGVHTSRPPVRRYVLSVVFTFGIVVLFIVGAGLLVIGPQTFQWIANTLGIEQIIATLWIWLRWPAGILFLMIGVATVYCVAPNTNIPFRLVSPGAMLSVITWIAASAAFAFYLDNYADYSAMYGSIGIMIALLLYLHLSTAVLLFGAEINAVLHQAAQRSENQAENAGYNQEANDENDADNPQ